MTIDTTEKQDVAMAAGVDVDTTTDEILLAATNHDIQTLNRLLGSDVGAANVQDPDTGFAPLHAAIAACEADDEQMEDADGEAGLVHGAALGEESCLATVKLLFENGAIWNELDNNDETPGCIAHRLGLKTVYEAIVQAGMRAELLFNRLDAYAPLFAEDSEEEEEEDEDDKIEGFEPTPAGASDVPVATGNGDVHDPVEGFEPTPNPSKNGAADEEEEDDSSVPTLVQTNPNGEPSLTNPNVDSSEYLTSNLEYSGDRLLDSDKNAVMMDWETEIMQKSVEKLVGSRTGLRTLNVGFGMGIIDGFFLAKSPEMHHIIEAHPQVHARMRSAGWYEKPNVTIHEGRWQDVLPKLVSDGVVLDGIYFDTFAEDYKDLKEFFQDYVIALLDGKGSFGFYNGLGADRQVCYDVYTRLVEMDLFDCGLDTEWVDLQVPDLDEKEEWDGVRHKYWGNVNPYKLPTCRFLG